MTSSNCSSQHEVASVNRGSHRGRRGVSTVIGVTLILASLLISIGSIIAFEAAYQASAGLQDQLQTRKRAQNFFILSTSPNGTQIVIFNNGQSLLHIVSVYYNHYLTKNLSIYILPETSGSIPSGTLMLNGGSIDVLSDLGNRATATFPVIGPTSTVFSKNKYVGTGPLSIDFENWTFLYQNQASCPNPTNQSAWAGVPNGIQPFFWAGLVNHATGNITLLNSSVLSLTQISTTSNNAKFYFIVGRGSSVCNPLSYDTRPAYVIPPSQSGDLATGGPVILVGFAVDGVDSTNLGPSVKLWNQQLVAGVFINVVFNWPQADSKGILRNQIFSEDIPFAALQLL